MACSASKFMPPGAAMKRFDVLKLSALSSSSPLSGLFCSNTHGLTSQEEANSQSMSMHWVV